MNDITTRFLDVYEWLKKEKLVLTPKGFAYEIEVSTSLITEICKKRTNAGITPIQNLINRFPQVNSNWLLTGQGDMLKSELKKEDKPSTEGTNTVELEHLRKENTMQAKIIAGLEFQVATLEQRLDQEKSVTRGVLVPAMAEPAPQLKEKTI